MKNAGIIALILAVLSYFTYEGDKTHERKRAIETRIEIPIVKINT